MKKYPEKIVIAWGEAISGNLDDVRKTKLVKPIALSLLPEEMKMIESSTKKKNLFIKIVLPFGVLFACCDEYLQSFISGRFSSGLDVLADSIGFLFGCLLIYWKYND